MVIIIGLDWIGELGCTEIKIESMYQFGDDDVIAIVVNVNVNVNGGVCACLLLVACCIDDFFLHLLLASKLLYS